MMAMTGAERQAAYRAKRASKDSGQRCINTWISVDAALALEALSIRYGVTRRNVIEMLLLRAESIPNTQITNDFLTDEGLADDALLRNDPPEIAAGSERQIDLEELLRNDEINYAQLHEPSPVAVVDVEVAQGGQYSLAL